MSKASNDFFEKGERAAGTMVSHIEIMQGFKSARTRGVLPDLMRDKHDQSAHR